MNKSDAEVDVASAMGRSSELKAPTGTGDDIEPAWGKALARKAGKSGQQEGCRRQKEGEAVAQRRRPGGGSRRQVRQRGGRKRGKIMRARSETRASQTDLGKEIRTIRAPGGDPVLQRLPQGHLEVTNFQLLHLNKKDILCSYLRNGGSEKGYKCDWMPGRSRRAEHKNYPLLKVKVKVKVESEIES
jgi:hypothetical protein